MPSASPIHQNCLCHLRDKKSDLINSHWRKLRLSSEQTTSPAFPSVSSPTSFGVGRLGLCPCCSSKLLPGHDLSTASNTTYSQVTHNVYLGQLPPLSYTATHSTAYLTSCFSYFKSVSNPTCPSVNSRAVPAHTWSSSTVSLSMKGTIYLARRARNSVLCLKCLSPSSAHV